MFLVDLDYNKNLNTRINLYGNQRNLDFECPSFEFPMYSQHLNAGFVQYSNGQNQFLLQSSCISPILNNYQNSTKNHKQNDRRCHSKANIQNMVVLLDGVNWLDRFNFYSWTKPSEAFDFGACRHNWAINGVLWR